METATPGSSPDSAFRLQDISKQLGDYIARLSRVWVEGELVAPKVYGRLVYVNLRDTSADMSMTMVVPTDVWGSLGESAVDGAKVVALVNPEWWTKKGSLQLRAYALRAVGVGDLLARIEQLRKVLEIEGLFRSDRKRPLPFLPRKVGLITGRDTDALKDVVVNARRRWPATQFVIREIPLQQAGTPTAAANALKELQEIEDVDVIVIARGGGSFEDLLPWSDEGLMRAVAAAYKPVVSAIGHENDHPILDDVADVRASTPTDAARKIVPDLEDETAQVDYLQGQLREHRRRWLENQSRHLQLSASALRARSPKSIVALRTQEVIAIRQQLTNKLSMKLQREDARIAQLSHRLSALSPFAVLARGYAVVTLPDGSVVRDQASVAPGSPVNIRVHEGDFIATRETTSNPSSSPKTSKKSNSKEKS